MKVEAQLIRDYLDRLEAAAEALPEDRRRELVADVTEHLTVALADPSVSTEADRRQVLDRLGEPEEIVRAALAEQAAQAVPPAPVAPAPKKSSSVLATVAKVAAVIVVLMILVGSGLFFSGEEKNPTPSAISPMPVPTQSSAG